MQKRIYRLIIIQLLILCITLLGCEANPSISSENNSTTMPPIIKVDLGFFEIKPNRKDIGELLPMAQPGQGFGLYLCDKDGKTYSQDTIFSCGTIPLFITLYSYVNENISYKFLQFIDFIETPVVVDKKEYSSGFDFDMPANSFVDIPLSVRINSDGLHEVLFVFVINYNNKSLDEEYRFNTNMEHLLTFRFFVKINNDRIPEIKYYSPSILLRNTNKRNTLLNKDRDEWTVWLTDTVKTGSTLPCFLHIGTAHSKRKERKAVIVLCDWMQVDIYNGEKVLYCEIDPDLEAIVPFSLRMPSLAGIYDVTTITTESPYDISSGFSPSVSFRIGINVADDK